jgi:hypothetical protein
MSDNSQANNAFKQGQNLFLIKTSIVRLVLISGVWFLFFKLYDLRYSKAPDFKPIVLGAIALYVFLELTLLIIRLKNDEKESLLSSFLKAQKKSSSDS